MELQRNTANKDRGPGKRSEQEPGGIYHCHSSSKATENRTKEQVGGRWKLGVAWAICLLLVIAEVVGKYGPSDTSN